MSKIGPILTATLLPFACGAATKYAFHRPHLGTSGVVLLATGALHAGAGYLIPTAIAALTAMIVNKASEKKNLSESTFKSIQKFTVMGTFGLSTVVYAIASKAILGRLKIPTSYTEALATVLIANIATECAFYVHYKRTPKS